MASRLKEASALGLFVFAGLCGLGYFFASGLVQFKQLERSVEVKGLSEREVAADIAVWPIRFSTADNELEELYESLERHSRRIVSFLQARGFAESDLTISAPLVTDKVAQSYGGQPVQIRYTASQTITVYTNNVDLVRSTKAGLTELGRNGILLDGSSHGAATEYLFTGLNRLKPEMVEEATMKARQVAGKFASDSDSTLGKIKSARQGQFTITDRDSNNRHLKKVRVVSTIEYYLSD